MCLPAPLAATASIANDATHWIVTITATAPICDEVTAAIYSMPDNIFFPWPQHKVEAMTLRVEPGVTTISFTKTCTPTQFDVVTGQTPDTIIPTTGPMHGPLLFTVPYTGVQNWPGACTPPPVATTTTVAEATTTAPASTTSTTGLGATTTASSTTIPGVVTTTTSPAGVLGATTVKPALGTAPSGTGTGGGATPSSTGVAGAEEPLAFTGSAPGFVLALAAALLLMGSALALGTRQRSRIAAAHRGAWELVPPREHRVLNP